MTLHLFHPGSPMRITQASISAILAVVSLIVDANSASAGMPHPTLTEPIPPNVELTEAVSRRFQSISFFLLLFLVSSLFVRWIWNALGKDFPRLPRLSYLKSLGLVGLWGMLFLL